MPSKLRVSRKLRVAASVLSCLVLLLTTAGNAFAASDGSGTMSVNQTTAAGGVSGQTFVFDFNDNSNTVAFTAGSQLVLTIPALWTAPQITSAANPGYVTVAAGASSGANACNPGTVLIAGAGPWTITIPQTCGYNDHLTITYGAGTSPAKVTTPTAASTYTFATLTSIGGGTLTAI